MDLFVILVCVFVLLLIYAVYKFTGKKNDYWTSRGVVNCEFPGLIGRTLKRLSFLDIDEHIYKQIESAGYGGYMELSKPALCVRDLDLLKNIYVKDFDHFVNRRVLTIDDNKWNNMVFNKSDREWKELRCTMSPAFTTGKIRKMYEIMNDSSKKLFSYLEEVIVKNEGVVDFEDALGRFAMDVICSAAFGIDSQIFRNKDSIVAKMARRLQFKVTIMFMIKFIVASLGPFFAKLTRFTIVDKEAGDFFENVLKDSIKKRETSDEKRNDFLQLMIDAKNGRLEREKGSNEEMDTYEKDAQLSENNVVAITDHLIISNCIGFIFGGHDTTQSALIFGAYALALNQDVQVTLRRELQDVTEHTGGELNYDIINRSEYLEKFVNEVFRMYTPAVRMERVCSKDYTLPNKSVIPKDTLIVIPGYQIHHDDNYFPNPKVFNPERFSADAKAKRHPYAFMPFGHGPRNCIANRFALTETKTALANLVLNFEIDPCAKTTIPMEYSMTGTLKPKHGMWLKLKSLRK